MSRVSFVTFALLLLGAVLARADDWPLESIALKDGRVFSGLIESSRDKELDFAEIVRPIGKPMFAVVRTFPRASVAHFERLSNEDHERLSERFRAFRNRAQIEAGRMEDVALTAATRDGLAGQRYDGNWYTMFSTADAETTRRAVVRVEQIFRAYRQLLPPRREAERKIKLLLYGSVAEYRADLAARRLTIENPAFYSANLNLIVAGSDLRRYAEQLERTRAQNETARRHYESLKADFSSRRAMLAEALKRAGFPRDEIAEELRIRQRQWDDELKSRFGEIVEANRKNDSLFGDVSRQMFARLNHEAFHAYLESYAYPSRERPAPRWLNEGLAQVFETAQLDGERLRIDGPHRETLVKLQADLAARPLPLAELLTAHEEAFLVTHVGGASGRHYLYSWGLAYYLAFHQNLLHSAALDRYLAPDEQKLDPLARFEALVGQPLPEFEKRWRDDMRAIKAPAK